MTPSGPCRARQESVRPRYSTRSRRLPAVLAALASTLLISALLHHPSVGAGQRMSTSASLQGVPANLIVVTVAMTDDGTADPICVAGDPNPSNDPAQLESCPG